MKEFICSCGKRRYVENNIVMVICTGCSKAMEDCSILISDPEINEVNGNARNKSTTN